MKNHTKRTRSFIQYQLSLDMPQVCLETKITNTIYPGCQMGEGFTAALYEYVCQPSLNTEYLDRSSVELVKWPQINNVGGGDSILHHISYVNCVKWNLRLCWVVLEKGSHEKKTG